MTCPPRIGPVIMLEWGSKKGGLKWPEEATDLASPLRCSRLTRYTTPGNIRYTWTDGED